MSTVDSIMYIYIYTYKYLCMNKFEYINEKKCNQFMCSGKVVSDMAHLSQGQCFKAHEH